MTKMMGANKEGSSMGKHTPGIHSENCKGLTGLMENCTVEVCCDAQNAIIAAAPEMLEACKVLHDVLQRPYHEMDDEACIKILADAIAKAEGRA